jgi:Protein of unknown function (DUF3987)
MTHSKEDEAPPTSEERPWERILDEEKAKAANLRDDAPLLDPWETYIVPPFPDDVLRPHIWRYVKEESELIGGDTAALAMSAMCACGGGADHRIKLKMLENSNNWYERPAIWTLLVGEPSTKKTPILSAAFKALEKHERDIENIRDEVVAAKRAELEALGKKFKDPEITIPKTVRYTTNDPTIEKLAEIIGRHNRGITLVSGEATGWLGGMEKYSGTGKTGHSIDRAFWLQAYDGRPYRVDRVSRGEMRVDNLSAGICAVIQPDVLFKTVETLTLDGLLQRFIPVMMRGSVFCRRRGGRVVFSIRGDYHVPRNPAPSHTDTCAGCGCAIA